MIIGFHHEDFLCTVETQMYIIFSGPTLFHVATLWFEKK